MTKVIKLKNNTYLYGTIIEHGSNNYGSYIKFSNGTMIVHRITSTIRVDINTTWGSLYVGKINDFFVFASQSFIEEPTVLYDIIPTSNTGVFKANYEAPTISTNDIANIWVGRPSVSTNVPLKIEIIAIGRWK